MKKSLLRICAAMLVLLLPTMVSAQRIERTINEAWRFTRDGKSVEVVNIPHSWNRFDSVDDTPGYFRGVGIYEKVLRINEDVDAHSFYIYFEGANQVTELWVNDHYVGKHIGGYSAFCFDITKSVRQGDNRLKIKVDNSHNLDIPPLSADFTFFGGIYRDLNLVITPKTHISTTHYASSGVYISTPQVSSESATVALKTMLTNRAERKVTAFVCHKIVSPSGEVVRELRSKVSLAPQSQNVEHTIECSLANPQLWSSDTPNLYKVYTSLCDKEGNVLDRVLNVIGLRSFSLDAERGFFLNGKPLKLMGTNRHQDYCGEANALSDAQHLADIRDIKALGSNFLRISHYPQDRLVPQMCDRLGMVTSIEIPIVNAITPSEAFLENSLEMIREMVYQDFNSPSVMIWAYMNEVLLRMPVNKKDEAAVSAYYAEVRKQAEAIEKLL
ncbi:MAG: beta-galactosidase, partial [Alistipes sp.]|nr:beta-galactosidase [Alistipes sp.]